MIMQDWAEKITNYLSYGLEILSGLVIGIALVFFLVRYVKNLFRGSMEHENQKARIRFGSSLTVALELLLAADILATAIAPSWDEIGKLAAIAALRTALNYFLEREISNSEFTHPSK